MIRCAFKTSTWLPTEMEWLRAASTISEAERTRISQFMFKRDAKQSMAGRLLMRSYFSRLSGAPPQTFLLDRDMSGKPHLVTPPGPLEHVTFNVSHAGEYAVFAAATDTQIGVDVMKVELRRNTTVQEFFSHMTRQFTDHEWSNIRCSDDQTCQLFNFYRHWCLKESFVKAIGTGLKFGLKRIEFTVGPIVGGSCCTTVVAIDGCQSEEWSFQEIHHDNHIITTAVKSPSSCDTVKLEILKFQDLNVNQEPLEDRSYFDVFNAKKEFPG